MSIIWVDSAATGAADGTSYTDAYTSLLAAAAVDVSGDEIYVVSTHVEPSANRTFNFVDAAIITVNSSGVYTEPTANNIPESGGDIILQGKMQIYGLWMSASDDFTPTGQIDYYGGQIECDRTLSGFFNVTMPGVNDYLKCHNTIIDLNGGHFRAVSVYGSAAFYGCTVNGSLSYLINHSVSSIRRARILFEDCDFSAHSATTVITGAIGDAVLYEFNRCQWPTGVTIVGTAIVDPNSRVDAYGCAFGDASQSIYLHCALGTVTDELGIYRTAGASNGDANTAMEAISSSAVGFGVPLAIPLGSQYIDTADYTTDVTFTVHFAVDGSTTALNSDEVWMEVEHVDGADNALGVLVDTKANPLATGTAPTTETSLWTGLGGTNKQMSINKTITIGTTAGTIASGLVRVNVYLGKASQTVFVCPQVEVS